MRRIGLIGAAIVLTACGNSARPTTTGHDADAHVSGILGVCGGVLVIAPRTCPIPLGIVGTVRWTNTKSGKVTEVRTKQNGTYISTLPAGTYLVEAGIGSGWPMGTCIELMPAVGPPRSPVTLQPRQRTTINIACNAA